MNKHFIFVVIILLSVISFNIANATEVNKTAKNDMEGIWVPQNVKSCNSGEKIEIFKEHLIVHYKSDSARFGDFDICYSCPGGVGYNGIEVWLTSNFNNPNGASFTLRFNDGERKGIMAIYFIDENLAKRFPFEKYKFVKCKK